MVDSDIWFVSKFFLVPFLFGIAMITVAAVYQFGIYALYIPGVGSIMVSLFMWSIIETAKRESVGDTK